MVARAQTDRESKREKLVAAAAGVFAARGYTRATMDDIAQAAGAAKGTLYLYFKSKEDLIYAVFEWYTAQSLGYFLGSCQVDAPAAQRLEALALGAARFMDENRQIYSLSLEVWAAAGTTLSRTRFSTALREMYAQYRSLVADVIRLGQQRHEFRGDLDVEAMAALLTGAMDGLLLQCWFDPAMDARAFIRGFFTPLLRGMRAGAPGDDR